MKVVFTKHAEEKFENLARVGVFVTKRDVIKTITQPDHLDREIDFPQIIASRLLSKTRILRVVYKMENDIMTVITFYPAKIGRYYENKESKN